MAGEFDVYQICPCGSGKKIKFCCQAIIAEMVKVSELQETHQYQTAVTLLDSAEKKVQPKDVWSRAWVKTTKAFLLFSLGSVDDPRALVREVLAELPEHPLAVAVNGLLALAAEGYPAAMRPLYRAFQIAVADQPHLTAQLAIGLARFLTVQGHYLAAGQNLRLALAFDRENEDAAEQFLAFMRDPRIPYPLREGYGLAPLAGSDNFKPQFDQAMKLAAQGCFSDAAKAFGGVARHDPKQPGLWWNIALCHAWAGEDPLAIEAFKAAAAHQPDFEAAVDCLALARHLRNPNADGTVPHLTASYRVESVSRLLTGLDQKPEFARVELDDVEDEDQLRPAGVFRLLDRDPKLVPNSSLSIGNVAHVIGEVLVVDRQDDEHPARAHLTCFGRDRLDRLIASFVSITGDLAVADGEAKENGFLRAEHLPLIQDWHLPDDLPAAQLDDLQRASSRRIIEEVWPNVPQKSLGGKTPREAAQSPELKGPLAAAVVELDSFCEKSRLLFDEAAVRNQLGLPALTYTPLAPEESGRAIPVLRLRHTAIDQLTDEDLLGSTGSVIEVNHSRLCGTVVEELLGRPQLQDKIDAPKLYVVLSRISARRLDHEAAVDWIVRGKQECKNRKLPLDALALWELQELMVRSQRRDDPELGQLAGVLWNYYLPKLPEMRETLVSLFSELALPGPWNAEGAAAPSIDQPLAAAGAGSTGLWTPEAQAAGQPSKLWLPGQ
jgi:tetratricopeptide (TPR) repeat protein